MVIGFLAHVIPYRARRGIGNFSYNLLKALLDTDRGNAYRCLYTIFGSAKRNLVLRSDHPHHVNLVWPLPLPVLKLLCDRWRILVVEDLFGGVDVFHAPAGPHAFLPTARRARTVITVHDVKRLRHPEFFRRKAVRLFADRIKRAADAADRILVVSANTKEELIAFTGIPKDKVVVTSEGIGAHFKPIKDHSAINATTRRYGVNGPYILYVGAAKENKNLKRLVTAFTLVKKETDIDHHLVLAGSPEWGYRSFQREIRSVVGLREDIVFPGYVTDTDLPHFYAGADVLAMPSIHEGFGLPAAEAMACGTPVLVSNRASFPEVVGDAGLQVDPYKADEIAAGLLRLIGDEELRRTCIQKGLARAKDMTWDVVARRVLSVYKEVA